MKNADRSLATIDLKPADSSGLSARLPPAIDDDGPIIILKDELAG